MEPVSELKELLRNQQDQIQQLKSAIHKLENSDGARENEKLKTVNEGLKGKNEALEEALSSANGRIDALLEENRLLKERLFEQMYAQRSELLNQAKRQTDILFEREEGAAENQLSAFSRAAWQRLTALKGQLSEQNEPCIAEISMKLSRLEAETREFMRFASASQRDGFNAERAAAESGYAEMERRQLTPGQVERKLRDNNMELRVGGRLTNVLGLIFIILAVILGLRYTFVNEALSGAVKGAVAYAIGLVFLVGGELMNRRRRNYFSLGLCAGGVGVLFASTAVSYFNLGILPQAAAVGLCMATALAALFLSYRYDAQIIAVFALVGGYLPMTAIENSPAAVFSSMIYFLLLSVFVLFVALRKNWRTIKYFCLVLSAGATGYLLFVQDYKPVGYNAVYILANFLLYTAIVLVYPILRKKLLRYGDTVLLGLNTVFSCGFVFLLLNLNNLDAFNGLVALLFCALYFGLGFGLKYAAEEDAGARGLFFATSFAFWVLAVPLQFDSSLITLGWLCEGVALSVFGIMSGRKWYKRAGYAISLTCFASFVLFDTLLYFGNLNNALYAWKFSMLALGAMVVLGVRLYKANAHGEPLSQGETVFKFFALVGVWGYLLWMSRYVTGVFINHEVPLVLVYRTFWSVLPGAFFSIGCAVLFRSIRYLRGRAVDIASNCLYIIGFMFTLALNAMPARPRYVTVGTPTNDALIQFLLVAFDLAAVYAVFHFVRVSQKPDVSVEWRPLSASLFALALTVQVLMVQYGYAFRNMFVSLVFITFAMAMIVFGFIKRYPYMRRFGLILSLLSVIKLFVLDLHMLVGAARFISIGVMGVVCLAVSYLYQMFSRKLLPATVEEAVPVLEQTPAVRDDINDE